jgi:AcrR family transcriptional regulator
MTVRSRATSMPPDERRSMIVAATLPLLVENGEMVTTRQIAEAAGIAEGTIFRVFDDKDAVIAAAIEQAVDTAPLEAALQAVDLDLPFEERLVEATVIMQQRVVDIWRLMSSIGPRFHDAARRPPADSDALIALFDPDRKQLRVDPATAARALRALTLAGTHPMLNDEPMTATEIVTMFLHGVAKADA